MQWSILYCGIQITDVEVKPGGPYPPPPVPPPLSVIASYRSARPAPRVLCFSVWHARRRRGQSWNIAVARSSCSYVIQYGRHRVVVSLFPVYVYGFKIICYVGHLVSIQCRSPVADKCMPNFSILWLVRSWSTFRFHHPSRHLKCQEMSASQSIFTTVKPRELMEVWNRTCI